MSESIDDQLQALLDQAKEDWLKQFQDGPSMRLPMAYRDLNQTHRRLVREEYARRQGGLCLHCKHPLSGHPSFEVQAALVDRSRFPIGFFEYPVHLHHNHKTGMTLGAVHALCNAVLFEQHGE